LGLPAKFWGRSLAFSPNPAWRRRMTRPGNLTALEHTFETQLPPYFIMIYITPIESEAALSEV